MGVFFDCCACCVMLECGMRVTAEHIDASFDSDACGVPTSTLVAFFFYVVFVT